MEITYFKRAHIILPTHKIIDATSEASKEKKKIGSTLKGIDPNYMDKPVEMELELEI